MARFRKTLYLIVEGCVLVTLSVTAGVLVMHENIFHQLPLYCFLEEKAQERSAGQDRETYEKLMESNARYLGRMVVDENKEVGSKETDRETEDKQSEREEDVEKDERPEKPTITPTEKPDITVTPIIQNTEEQKAKNADKQTEPEENLAEESPGEEEVTTAAAQVQPMPEIDLAPERLADYDYLMNHFFILDPNTETSAQQLNAAALLGEDLTLRKEKAEPQILIYGMAANQMRISVFYFFSFADSSIFFLISSSDRLRCSLIVLRTRFISLAMSASLISIKYDNNTTFLFFSVSVCSASAINASLTSMS